MKIAYITDGIFPSTMGGMAKFSANLLGALLELDSEIDVFLPLPVKGAPTSTKDEVEKIPARKIEWIAWPKCLSFPGHYLYENWLFSKVLATKVQAQGYDVVYAHGLTSWALSRMRKDQRPALVSNLHGFEAFQPKHSFREFLHSFLFQLPIRQIVKGSDYSISLGSFFSDLLVHRLHLSREQVAQIPNAITLDFFTQSKVNSMKKAHESNEALRFLFVGRNEKRKGLELFLAMARKFPKDQFHVVGDVSLKFQNSFRPNKNIWFHGAVWNEEELISHYHGADALIVPSYAEGMPTVILEAMAAGLPVLASNVGCNPDLLQDGTGLIFSPGNPVALENTIKEFSSFNSSQRQMMGERGRELVERKYTWPKVAQMTMDLLKKAMAEKLNL